MENAKTSVIVKKEISRRSSRSISLARQILLGGLVFLVPLFFLPIAYDIFYLPKNTLVIGIAGLYFLLSLVKIFDFQERKIRIRLGKTGSWLLVFVLSLVTAGLLTHNPRQDFLQSGLYFIFLWLLFFSLINSGRLLRSLKTIIAGSLVVSACVLSLFLISQHLGWLNWLGETVVGSLLNSKDFVPIGSMIYFLFFLALNLPLTIVWSFKQRSLWPKILISFLAGFQIIGLILAITYLFSEGGQAFRVLPLRAGWLIGVDSLKAKPLFGFGPDNFLTAFYLYRPAFLNLNPNLWNLPFFHSTNVYLHLLTISGPISLILFFILSINFFNRFRLGLKNRNGLNWFFSLGLLLIFLFGFLFVFDSVFWFLLFVFLGIFGADLKPKVKVVDLSSQDRLWLTKGFLTFLIFGILLGGYLTARSLAADFYFKQSQDSLAKNQGNKTYNNQLKAIRLNPVHAGYRAAFSNTNFLLANSLAGQKDLSDQDRERVTILIQQAIKEAKLAINFNPQNTLAWQNLARIYRGLINFAQGADQWALEAYRRAAATAPTDPALRVEYGGLFYSLQNYELAIDQFRRATELKPDYAKAFYNLAAAYKENNEEQKAYFALQRVLGLIDLGSPDFEKVNQEFKELERLISSSEEIKADKAVLETERVEPELVMPELQLETTSSGQIELPEKAGPEDLLFEETVEEESTDSAD
jgi:tetratricopeptide (TPR) repeat protein